MISRSRSAPEDARRGEQLVIFDPTLDGLYLATSR